MKFEVNPDFALGPPRRSSTPKPPRAMCRFCGAIGDTSITKPGPLHDGRRQIERPAEMCPRASKGYYK